MRARRFLVRPSGIRPGWWRAGLIVWGVALVVAVLALAVFVLQPMVAGDLAWLHPSQPAVTDVRTATRLGPAQDFTLALFDGGSFRLADQRGSVVVVNFWASWCVPCRTETPRLESASEAYRDRGVVFVGVDVQDSGSSARAFIQQFHLTYPTGEDRDLVISNAYGVASLPTTLFVDRQGQVRRRWLGILTDAQLTAFIDEALQ